MGRWLLLLGGLLVWFAHFLGVYGVASVADVVAHASAPAALWTVAALTGACAAADVAIGAIALRRGSQVSDDLDRFLHGGAVLGAGLSLVAVVWQGLPALIGV